MRIVCQKAEGPDAGLRERSAPKGVFNTDKIRICELVHYIERGLSCMYNHGFLAFRGLIASLIETVRG